MQELETMNIASRIYTQGSIKEAEDEAAEVAAEVAEDAVKTTLKIV
jgi:hypothetical protein